MLLKWQNITQPWLGQDCFHWFSVPLYRVSYVNATLIAHIWSNFDDKNAASGVVQCDLSDHYAMFANFPSNSVSKNEKKKRFPDVAILRRLMTVFELSFSTFNWNSLCDINNANSCYSEFMLKFTSIYDSHFPIKTIKVTSFDQSKPYIDSVIKKTIEREKKLYKKYYLRPITFERQYKRIKSSKKTIGC